MKKKENQSVHWSKHKEQVAGYWHVKLLLVLFKIFPVIILRILAFPVGFFYFVFSRKGRAESKRFLKKAAPLIDNPKISKKCRSPMGPLRHIISFSLTLTEKIQTWGGKFSFKNIYFQDDDIEELIQMLEDKKGVFLIMSHLGNIELLRGLANFSQTGVSRNVPVTAIIDMNVSENFTRMIKELNPDSAFNVINARDIGADTVIILEEKLAQGEIVTITGDRTSVNINEENFMIPFLEEEAPLSPGIFYLAVLMKMPVYYVFSLRRGDLSLKPLYDMHVYKCPLSFDCGRNERRMRSLELARSFAALLEKHCKEKPFQWYNFYDFWSKQGA